MVSNTEIRDGSEKKTAPYVPEERWTIAQRSGDFQGIAARFGISPVMARLIRNRGVKGDEAVRRFLNGNLSDLEDPLGLNGILKAAKMLHSHILTGKKIRVIGDYDIDGICATYILTEGLEKAGACVDYAIPDRIQDGFGLNIRLVEKAAADGIEVILTCDNGIAAAEQIRFAKECGISVIVTDHHEPPFRTLENGERSYILPDADVLVDPKKPDCGYPNKDLCGAALAWKLMYVYESVYGMGFASDHLPPVGSCPFTLSMLPFAAFATVGDVMHLTGENRILVKTGLEMLQDTDHPGLRALIRSCALDDQKLSCYHIGFVLGPCLNASGRLDSAVRSVELMRTKDPLRAEELAAQLRAINEERKEITETGAARAFELIDQSDLGMDRVLVVYLPGIHESVAGIIASRIKERYNKPVLVFTDSEDPDVLKGSGRSIEAYPMFDSLNEASDLFVKFGGHEMAAGASVRRSDLDKLRRKLNETCTLMEDDLKKQVRIDMELPFRWVTETFVDELELLEPTGNGNRRALFVLRDVRLCRMWIVGREKKIAKLLLEDAQGQRIEGILFDGMDRLEELLVRKGGAAAVERLKLGQPSGLTLTMTYHASVNEFRGLRTPQVIIQNFY